MPTYTNAFPNWAQDVLRAIGAPVTKANVNFLNNWHAHEGSNASNNPLNVTGYAPIPVTVGTGSINGDGVQNYATAHQGVQATAAFLNMPNYASIKAALQSGDPTTYTYSHAEVIGALGTWGSHSFANWFAGLFKGGFQTAGEAAAAATAGNPIGGTVDAAVGAASTVANDALAVPRFLAKLADPVVWERSVYVVGGTVLMGGALYIIARELGAKPPLPSVKVGL